MYEERNEQLLWRDGHRHDAGWPAAANSLGTPDRVARKADKELAAEKVRLRPYSVMHLAMLFLKLAPAAPIR